MDTGTGIFTGDERGNPWDFCRAMLDRVSRTFALNIVVLPSPLKRPVLAAYLLCRIADTIEDQPGLTIKEKLELLELYRLVFDDPAHWRNRYLDFLARLPDYLIKQDDPESVLVIKGSIPLECLFAGCPEQMDLVRPWIMEMCRGMILYIERGLVLSDSSSLVGDVKDLEEYCYFVAGTVGHMLTDLFRAYSPWIGPRRYEKLKTYACSFGVGLQLTNIIKDSAHDRLRDISYIPEQLVALHGITADELFLSGKSDAALGVMNDLIRLAFRHLEDANAYSLAIPRREPRIRLFCFWPMMMAAQTLVIAHNNEKLLKSDQKVKITRKQLKQVMGRSTLYCLSNNRMKEMFMNYRAMIDRTETVLTE